MYSGGAGGKPPSGFAFADDANGLATAHAGGDLHGDGAAKLAAACCAEAHWSRD
jgi:hypothetical protein